MSVIINESLVESYICATREITGPSTNYIKGKATADLVVAYYIAEIPYIVEEKMKTLARKAGFEAK